jgi:hypothetical protein
VPLYSDSEPRTLNEKLGEFPSVLDYGAVGDGTANDHPAFQAAVDTAAGNGGGKIFVPWGVYNFEDELELKSNVILYGEGYGSEIKCVVTLDSPTKAVVSVVGDEAGLRDIAINGIIDTPTVLKYADFSTNPMDGQLTQNTSVWVRPGHFGFSMHGVTIHHTGGYAALIDSDTADVWNVLISGCTFTQNRPHIWETADGVHDFGSWTGGIFYRGDCRASEGKLFSVRALTVSNCAFRRCTGNQVWGHCWGFDIQHKNVIVEACTFEDIGRDAILYGNVLSGSARGNTMRRIGYLTYTDSDTPVQPTGGDLSVGIDTSGYCSGVDYSGNTVVESSGAEAFDLDGFRDGVLAGNTVDSCFIGINTGDTQNNGAGKRVAIYGNAFRNCGYGTMRLNDTEDCTVEANTVEQPATATEAPIQFNAVTALGCKNNLVTGNRLQWNKDDYCVKEAAAGGTFDTTCENRVFGNHISGTNRGEFAKHVDSLSSTAYIFSTADPTATTRSEFMAERVGFGSGAAWQWHTRIGGTKTAVAQYQDLNRMFLVGIEAGKGAIATGNRSGLIWGTNSDAMATSKLYLDGFMAIVGKSPAGDFPSTYSDAQADAIYSDEVLLLGYDAPSKTPLMSVAVDEVSPGVFERVWVPWGGAGSISGTAHEIVNTAGVLSLAKDGLHVYAATGIAEPVVTIRGELAQAQPLLSLNKSDNTVLTAFDAFGTMYAPAAALRSSTWGVGSSTIEARYAGQEIRFKQASSEQADAGTLSYRNIDGTSLVITGSGTAVFDRLIRLHDRVVVFGKAATPALSTQFGYFESAEGFVTSSAQTNAIQAPTGGVTARFLIASRSVSVLEDTAANAGLSSAGNGRIYFDDTLNKFRVSENGNAYVDLIGGGISGLTAGRIPYTTGASSIADSGNLQWSNGTQAMTIIGTANTNPALSVTTGYIDAAGGLNTNATATNAIQAAVGGVTARFLVGTRSLSMTSETEANAGLSSAGNGRIFFDVSGNKFRVSQNGAAYVDLVGGGLSGLTTGRIPYTTGASTIADTANLVWNNATRTMGISAQNASTPGIDVIQGYVAAAGGFLSTATNFNSIQTSGGVRTGLGTSGTGKVYINFSPSFLGTAGSLGRPVAFQTGVHVQNEGESQAGDIYDCYSSGTGLPAIIGRRARGSIASPGEVFDGDNLLVFGGRGWQQFASDFPSALNAAIAFVAAGQFTGSSTPTRITLATTPVGSTSRATRLTVNADGIVVVAGTAAQASFQVAAGYISSNEGFSTPALTTNAIQAVSGGVTARYLIGTRSFSLTGDSEFNAGLSTFGNGRIFFDSSLGKFRASQNGGAYVDLVGGSGGVTSVSSANGNRVTVSPTTGSVLVNLPDTVFINAINLGGTAGTTTVVSNGITQTRGLNCLGLSAWNALQTTDGGIAASGNWGFSLIDPFSFTQDLAIDYSGGGARFVGTGGVNCGSAGGISGAGFNPNVSGSVFTGYSSDASFGFGNVFSVFKVGGGQVTLRFTRGALTFFSDP